MNATKVMEQIHFFDQPVNILHELFQKIYKN